MAVPCVTGPPPLRRQRSTSAPPDSVQIWHAHRLQPQRVPRLKFSNQCRSAHAIVLSVDEKSLIQALDRTGKPMMKVRAGTMAHDYERHGSTTPFAVLDVLKTQSSADSSQHGKQCERKTATD